MSNKDDISKELSELSTVLSKTSKEMPFNVPNDYFETLPTTVFTSAQTDSLKKEQTFELPEGYFDSLPNTLLDKIKQEDTQPDVTPTRKNTISIAIKWAAAAILIVGVGIGSFFVFNNTAPNFEQQLAEIPTENINDYIQDNIHDFDLLALESSFDEDALNNFDTEGISENDIEQYIDEVAW